MQSIQVLSSAHALCPAVISNLIAIDITCVSTSDVRLKKVILILRFVSPLKDTISFLGALSYLFRAEQDREQSSVDESQI